MGRDCLWDIEEQHREWTAQLICSSLLYGTRLPLGQRGATQRIDCTADLLLNSIWDKTASGTARSSKLMLWTTDLLLDSVWDKTASGTARSKMTENCGSLWQSGTGRSCQPLWEPRGAKLNKALLLKIEQTGFVYKIAIGWILHGFIREAITEGM